MTEQPNGSTRAYFKIIFCAAMALKSEIFSCTFYRTMPCSCRHDSIDLVVTKFL